MNARHVKTILAVVSLLMVLRVTPEAQGAGLGVDWKEFGRQTMASAPPEIRNGSEPVKARYLGARVAEKYASLGVAPNTSAVGRVNARVKWGDPEVGTCGNLTNSLLAALNGAGFKPNQLISLVAEKSLAKTAEDAYTGKDFVNPDHGGAGVAIGGKIWVLDVWRYTLESRTFKGYEKSPYNLIPLDAWGARMVEDGYSKFSSLGGSGKSYDNVNQLAGELEGGIRSGSRPTPDTVAEVGPKVTKKDKADDEKVGLHLWPKLEGSGWSGEITIQESNEDGSGAPMVFPVSLSVDSGNNLTGTFDFIFWYGNDLAPYRVRVGCNGKYDRSTGQFDINFDHTETKTEKGAGMTVIMPVTLKGTFSGGVESDRDDQAQGDINGTRVAKAAGGGGTRENRISVKGTWRMTRTN